MPTTNPNRGGLLIGLGALGFFAVLLLMGVDAVFFGYFVASRNVATSQRWVETRCEIVEARVERHADFEHGDSYSLHVKFKYEFDRQEYISDRYDLSYFGHSEAEGRAVVSNLPPGTQTVCFVNPDDPSEAVMNRERKSGALIGGVVMITLGLVGILFIMIIGMGKNPIGMIGDIVFLSADKVLSMMEPSDATALEDTDEKRRRNDQSLRCEELPFLETAATSAPICVGHIARLRQLAFFPSLRLWASQAVI